MRDLGDRTGEATALSHLGETHYATGDTAAVHTAWQAALEIFTALGHPEADNVRTRLLGLVGR